MAMGWSGAAAAAAGIVAVIASVALLLTGIGPVVPMMGFVAGVAVMLGASLRPLSCASKLSKRRLGWRPSR